MHKFFNDYKLSSSDIDMHGLVTVFTEDILSGLERRNGALRMIPTYIEADNDFITDKPVLAIDAGGTNFRAALITITGLGKNRNKRYCQPQDARP